MNRRLRRTVGALLASAALLTGIGVSSAAAQTTGPPSTSGVIWPWR